ncbi:hypothetical protein PVAND_007997 [Polypedilum vanderplanki]|uniref:Uncharacterized protein n=1 Tax=Polypedilum vanderplanki TaxID=319348 RepID=A0A9J6C8K4_POLVA|nr:hypothetical protein PVAND_007997 [Polypedilum vanderplanki]
MLDQEDDMGDIENQIPSNEIVLNRKSAELKVVNQRLDAQGFLEKNVELFHLPRVITRTTSSSSTSNIHRTICLSIEDLKQNCKFDKERDCWQFRTIQFKSILLYGRVTIKNESIKHERSFYTINIDDESDSIDGYLNKSTQLEMSKNKQSMTIKKNELQRREKETGINLRGTHYDMNSVECQKFLKNLKGLQEMIQKNFCKTEKVFPLGILKENCLVYAFPFVNNNQEIRLNVIDLTQNDSLELLWKRNLNRLYNDYYQKQL